MKTVKMLTILVLGLVVCQAEVSKAAPMGTAWTYQGRLMDDNNPADGQYDFQFKLYNDANTFIGNQLGDTIDINDLDVIEGNFTVELDFGPDVFTGYTRWLETTIRRGDSNDVNDFVTLSPRQELTPTPYAIYAKTTGAYDWMVSGSNMYSIPSGNVGIGTTRPQGKLEVSHDGVAYDLVINSSTGNVGIGTNVPNEKLTVDGALSLEEISPPSESSGYGKFYVKSPDGKLCFMNDGGTEYDLTASGEDFIVGDFLISANDTERSTAAPSATLLKMTKIGRGGTLRIKFDLCAYVSGIAYGAIYRNNVIVAPIRMTKSTEYVTFTEDISGWSKGDLVQVYVFTSDPAYHASVRNFRLYAYNPAEAGIHPSY